MKKYFNEKHEAIIRTTPFYAESTDGKKDGDHITTRNGVHVINWNQPKYDQFGNHIGIELVSMSRDQLFDLHEQCKQIESKLFMSEYSSLPF